jgi:hypothetical protein
VIGERQVGQVVVPDPGVEHELVISVAPGIAGPRVLLDDDGGNAEALEPSAERDAALAAADEDAIGLHRVAERRLVRALALEGGAMGNAFWRRQPT